MTIFDLTKGLCLNDHKQIFEAKYVVVAIPPLFYCTQQHIHKCHTCHHVEVPQSEILPLKQSIGELSGMDTCIEKAHNFL